MVEKLRALELRAKADGNGQWDANSDKIKTSYELINAQEFVQRWKGKPIEGAPLRTRPCPVNS